MQEAVCRWIDEHDVQEAVCRWIDEHDVQEVVCPGGCVLEDMTYP